MAQILSDEQLEAYLNTLNDSDDGMESSGGEEEDDHGYYRDNRELLQELKMKLKTFLILRW